MVCVGGGVCVCAMPAILSIDRADISLMACVDWDGERRSQYTKNYYQIDRFGRGQPNLHLQLFTTQEESFKIHVLS